MAIVSTGVPTSRVVLAAELPARGDIEPTRVHVPTLKLLDEMAPFGDVRFVVTVEGRPVIGDLESGAGTSNGLRIREGCVRVRSCNPLSAPVRSRDSDLRRLHLRLSRSKVARVGPADARSEAVRNHYCLSGSPGRLPAIGVCTSDRRDRHRPEWWGPPGHQTGLGREFIGAYHETAALPQSAVCQQGE